MKLATWNVNSIRQRERHVGAWLARVQPDVLFLQELKCEAPAFPTATFEALGYRAEVVGQKAYNGVAVLSRVPFTVVHRALPGLPAEDAQARYVEIEAGGITAIGIYMPNGNSGGGGDNRDGNRGGNKGNGQRSHSQQSHKGKYVSLTRHWFFS